MELESGESFIAISRSFLREYRDKIQICIERLSDEEVWWRPNDESNSAGNLLLHVTGSLRQWIVSGIGGRHVHRLRQQEFDERSRIPKDELFSRLDSAVREVDEVLSRIDPSQLLEKLQIFGKERTWMFVIYHMIEHFSMHAGQILMITKLKTARDLGLQ